MTIKNAYSEIPNNVKPGDQFLFVIKAMVLTNGEVRFYRCQWNPEGYWDGREVNYDFITENDVPQGDQIYGDSILQDIFPVLNSYITYVRDNE